MLQLHASRSPRARARRSHAQNKNTSMDPRIPATLPVEKKHTPQARGAQRPAGLGVRTDKRHVAVFAGHVLPVHLQAPPTQFTRAGSTSVHTRWAP